MNADLIIFCFLPTTTSGRPIRPFRLLRVCKLIITQLFPCFMTHKSENHSNVYTSAD